MDSDHTPTRVALIVAALLCIAALGYAAHDILSPFVLTAGVAFLLYPLRHDPLARRLLWFSVLLFSLWFLYAIIGILTPFLIAFLIAYILNPLVTLLHRRRVPRWVSSLVLVLVFVGGIAALVIFLLPPAVEQFQAAMANASAVATQLSTMVQSGAVFEWLNKMGVSTEKAREMLTGEFGPRVEAFLRSLFGGLFGILSGVSSVVAQLLNIVLVPFIAFYLLMDFPVVTERFAKLVPRPRRQKYTELTGIVDDLLGNYFRGAISVAAIQGTIAGVGLWIIGVDYPLVLGLMTGVLDFIPYLGLVVSLVVSCVVALFSGGAVATKVWVVIILFLSQKVFEATVLGPKIIGKHVGLHPVLLILCLLVFGQFLGFVGLLIAVPATALIIAGVKEWERGRKSRLSSEGNH